MSKTLFTNAGLGELQVGGLFFNLNAASTVLPDNVADLAVSRLSDRGANTSTPMPPATDEAADKQYKSKPQKTSHN